MSTKELDFSLNLKPNPEEDRPMTATDPRAWLTEAQERASKATPGPWENDGGGDIGQHWSSPAPRQEIVTTEVSCMSYCYGGSARGVEKDADAEFIAHSRTEHPAMSAALTAVLGLHYPLNGPHEHLVCAHRHCIDDAGDQCRWPCMTARAVTENLPKEDDRG